MSVDLVFEGGGAKGMVFVGAMRELERRGLEYRRLLGTSAGAITATLLAAGYTAEEMAAALEERDADGNPVFESFMDPPEAESFSPEAIRNSLTMQLMHEVDLPFVPESVEDFLDRQIMSRLLQNRIYRMVFSFVERGGLYAGEVFRTWFARKLDEKAAGYSHLTLEELNSATGVDLSVVASDTTGRNMLVLNHRTAPECPVVWAVRMSMSIPFAWQEVLWQAEWGTFLGQELTGHTVVDGGVLSNFPINLAASASEDVRVVMGDTDPSAADTLGLLIDEQLEVPGAPPPPDEGEVKEHGVDDLKRLRLVRRVSRLMSTMMNAHDRKAIAAYEARGEVCRLPAKDYGTMEFDMSEARRKALVDAGEQAMRNHFEE